MKPAKQRAVITGMGAITPIGNTPKDIETSLRQSRSGVRDISLFDTEALPVKFAGEAKDFKPENFLDAKEIRRNDRFIQMCLAATEEAVRSSGASRTLFERAGVAIGVGLGGLYSIETGTLNLKESGPKKISPFIIPSILSNLASGQVSIKYGIKGPNFAISSACASGAQAVGHAFREIQSGRRDIWIAGGAEAPITPLSIAGFSSARALSRKNENPSQASRPFDEARDGFVLGEGAASFVIESLESASNRGATILAEIVGFGIASDSYHITEPDPEGLGARLAMEEALSDAGISAEQVDYVNAHATSTYLGDKIEALATKAVFGNRSESLFVSSTKSLTGHSCGAAGAIEAAFCTLMMTESFLPPAFNLVDKSPEFCFKSPTASELSLRPNVVMNNSFGFGGINTSMILSREGLQ